MSSLHSKINVMDSEIIDDVESEFSLNTAEMPTGTIFAQTSTPASLKGYYVSAD